MGLVLPGLALAFLMQTTAPPRILGWDDFPVFVWRETHRGEPLPVELCEPFGGVILMRGEDPGWARERGLATLIWNVAGRDVLHLDADQAWRARVEDWIKEKDRALLARTPCLRSTETRTELYATLAATIERHAKDPRLTYVLGDEVGTTPNGDPFDLCRCEPCEAAWRKHAEPLGLPARAPLTDEVLSELRSGTTKGLGAWLARRRFERQAVLDLLFSLRARLLEHPPYESSGKALAHHQSRPLPGLLGTKGLTAFGGIDLASLGSLFEVVEPYPVNEAREALAAADHVATHELVAKSGPPAEPLASLTTVFLEEETPDGAAWKLWEHWLRGGNGAVLWSDAVLERSPDHRERLAQAVQDIRKLSELGRLRHHRGGALVYDADSIAASFLRDALEDGDTWPRRTAGYQAQHGTRDRKVRSWLRLIEDCGELPVALPLESVRGECADEFGFLVLPEILVLGPEEVRHLEDFLAEGGTLILDGGFGWVDRQGRPWSEDLGARLARRAKARVLHAPDELEDYLEQRLDRERAAPARNFLRPLLAQRPRRHPSRTAVFPELSTAFPWLVNRDVTWPQRTAPLTVIAMLPNLPTSADRTRLVAVELPEVPAAEGVWLHPSSGTTLRAGDAAVFLPRRFLPAEEEPQPVPLGPYKEPRPR